MAVEAPYNSSPTDAKAKAKAVLGPPLVNTQAVATDRKGNKKLIVLAELPGHVLSQAQLDISCDNGQEIEITRPLGKGLMDSSRANVVMGKMPAIHPKDRIFFHQVLDDAMKGKRKKVHETLFETHVIPLCEAVELNRPIIRQIYACSDRSVTLLMIFEMPSEHDYRDYQELIDVGDMDEEEEEE